MKETRNYAGPDKSGIFNSGDEGHTKQDMKSLLELRRGKYRQGEREHDFLNEQGIISFRSNNKTFVRCASKLISNKNLMPEFTERSSCLYRVHGEIDDFFKFAVNRSRQGARLWGKSVNLAICDELEELLRNPILLDKAEEVVLILQNHSKGASECQNAQNVLLDKIATESGWKVKLSQHEARTVAGGLVAYKAGRFDKRTTVPPAVGIFSDVLMESEDKTRTVVIEMKKPGEIKKATSGSALVQLMTGAVGWNADVGLICVGNLFGVYWFVKGTRSRTPTLQIHKFQSVSDLIEINTAKELLRLYAHVAFFLADPFPGFGEHRAKKLRLEVVSIPQQMSDTHSTAPGTRQADQGGDSEQPGERTLTLSTESPDRSSDDENRGGRNVEASEIVGDVVENVESVWETLLIEGKEDVSIECVRLRVDLAQTVREKILAKLELDDDE